MTSAQDQKPRLIFPALGCFYDRVAPYCYPLVRFAVGAVIIPNGWGKLMGPFGNVVNSMAKQGFHPAGLAAVAVIATETLGGLCVALGFFTRFWAAAIAIEMAVLTFVVQWHNGYPRVEQFLLWGVLAFVVALRGSGRCSVDRMIGWEL